MTLTLSFSRRIHFIFHSLGLSCLGGAIFLQILVLADILQHSYFMAVEQNSAILAFEVVFTVLAAIYFIYISA
jgi:hypothetical protein